MVSHLHRRAFLILFGSILVVDFLVLTGQAQQPLIPGYMDYTAFADRVRKLDDQSTAIVETLGATANGRELFAIKLATTGMEVRPAILILAGGDSQYPASSELAIRLAERLSPNLDVLNTANIYIIPRANPDGLEKAIERPIRARLGNGTVTDDDRDGQIAEDPPEDLNGDGWITQMRVFHTGGTHRADKEDARLNVAADPAKNEPGEFDIRTEGIDNDHDDQWNEDAGDGVEFNRNFSFKYPAFEHHSGPNAVSELETRAVADFCFDHPEIQVVYVLGLQDNMVSPWKPSQEQGVRVPVTIASGDNAYFAQISNIFRDRTKITAIPTPPSDAGSFLSWVYFHYGRWAIGNPGYSPPSPTPKEAPPEGGTPGTETTEGAEPRTAVEGQAIATQDTGPPGRREIPEAMRRRGGGRRGRPGSPGGDTPSNGSSDAPADIAQERLALRWMDENKMDGFVPWTEYAHPDFPHRKVEIGGFKPQWRANPPVAELDRLADEQLSFVVELAKLFPRLELARPRIEALGKQLFRVELELTNLGYLPTSTEFGASGRMTHPVQIELKLPAEVKLLHDSPRSRERRIPGNGAVQRSWILQSHGEGAPKITVRAGCPMTGYTEREFELKAPE